VGIIISQRAGSGSYARNNCTKVQGGGWLERKKKTKRGTWGPGGERKQISLWGQGTEGEVLNKTAKCQFRARMGRGTKGKRKEISNNKGKRESNTLLREKKN